ncbi:ubiquitin family protein [Ceratobasidium sp. AG-Ba]|nr:ubiquitin family protein [Ceratobasidium sp. AG-Ba]
MSNNANPPASANLPYYVAKYKGRTVAIKRDSDYQTTIKLMQKSIAKLRSADPQDIIISTALADYGDAVVQISEEIWPDVVDDVKVVEVSLEEATDSKSATTGLAETGTIAFTPRNSGTEASSIVTNLNPSHAYAPASSNFVESSYKPGSRLSITIRTNFQDSITLDNLPMPLTAKNIKNLLQRKYNLPAELQQFKLAGVQLNDNFRIDHSSVTRGDPLDLALSTRRSIIYLIGGSNSNQLYQVIVQITVNRKWELAALFPHASVPLADYIQSVSCNLNNYSSSSAFDPEFEAKRNWFYWDGRRADDC